MSVIEINTEQQLEQYVLQYPVVILDVYGEWCGPCKAIAPHYHDLASKYTTKDIVFLKCDVATNVRNVQSIPAFHFFQNGRYVHEIIGAKLPELKEMVVNLCGFEVPDTKKKGDGYKRFADMN